MAEQRRKDPFVRAVLIRILDRFRISTSTNQFVLYNSSGPKRPFTPEELLSRIKTNLDLFNFLCDAVVEDSLSSSSKVAESLKKIQDGGAKFLMRNTAYVFLNGRCVYNYTKQANFNEEAGDPDLVYVPGARGGVVDIEGIRFGFEICMDHTVGYLARQIRPGQDLMVQVVLSDYVNPVGENRDMVRVGGYFVHATTLSSLSAQHPDVDGRTAGVRAGVYRKVGPNRFQLAKLLGQETVAGSNLAHFEAELDVDDPFALAGTFMEGAHEQ